MAEVYINSDLNTDGKIKLSTVPNSTGTVMTYNPTTKELSTRTNAQIIADLGLDGGGLSSYVKKAGDTMTGSLTMNNAANTVINKDLSTITASSGFARDMFRLTGTNGIIDVMGWQGTVDNTGNITAFGYGYLGGTAYNVKNAIRWNANQQVRIGSTGVPGGNYALEVDGNTLSRGGYDSQNGYFNTVSGELLVQRFGVNRIRTNTASLILSGDTSNGIVYIRPQGDAVATSEVQFRSNLTAVFPSTYNLYFGNQSSEGGSIFHTNQANTTFGYGMWMNYNLQFDGTNFIQPRGSGVTSFAFTANQHKGFSFNVAPPNGTNGGIVSLTEVVRFGSSGTITTLNDGNSAQWNSAYVNGFVYKGTISASTDLNTITAPGWYVQALNANATTALNYPVANLAGHLRVYGGNATHIVQEYTTYSTNNDSYRRYYFSGTWSPWTKDWDSNDFTQTNVNSWNNIALNGATQQWVDQYYINKSTQNIVKSADWFITDDASGGMEGRFRFQGGYPVIQWDNSSALFGDEGFIDLNNYGIRQNNSNPNELRGYTTFFGKAGFSVAQGTAPFDVISSTLVTNLNADLLDGRHASDFMLSNQAGNYIDKASTNSVLLDNWSIIGNTSYPDKGYFKFKSPYGYPEIGFGDSNLQFTDEGTIDLNNYGFRQNNVISNYFQGDTTFKGVYFSNAQGTAPFNVDSTTLVTNLNADLLDGFHASSFAQATQLANYVPTSRTLTINGTTFDLSANRTWNIPTGSTYTAGAGLTLSGTTFSLPVTVSGTGNGVASVVQNATGITVNKTDFALSSDLTNFVTVTGAGQTITSPKTFNANVNVNATLQANGLLGNGSQSNNEVWTTDGGYRDLTEIVRPDGQWRLNIDGTTTAINLRPYHDLGVVIYEGGGIEDTAVALPRITRQGQEAQVINRGTAVVFVTKVGSSVLVPVDPGMTLRFVFTLDNNVGDITDDKEGLGTWVHVASEKYTEL
jgi:hypothetical protein